MVRQRLGKPPQAAKSETIILEGMTFEQQVVGLRNARASDWMHRGMALADRDAPENLIEATLCFDEAIALRLILPLAEAPWFRYALSAGWINRADVLARFDRGWSFTEALASYDEALTLLRDLPLDENPLYARRLAITWIHRGVTIQNRGNTALIVQALACFESAIRILDHPSAAGLEDRRVMQAGAWANLAAASLLCTDCSATEICRTARIALALTTDHERIDLAFAQIGFAVRLTLCRFAVQRLASGEEMSERMLAQATDAVDSGMELARQWEAKGATQWRETARELFCLGCRIYREYQPRSVAEFILESLDPQVSSGALSTNDATTRAAAAAIWGMVDRIQRKGFEKLHFFLLEGMLADVRQLQAVDDRLKELARQNSAVL